MNVTGRGFPGEATRYAVLAADQLSDDATLLRQLAGSRNLPQSASPFASAAIDKTLTPGKHDLFRPYKETSNMQRFQQVSWLWLQAKANPSPRALIAITGNFCIFPAILLTGTPENCRKQGGCEPNSLKVEQG